MVDNITSAESSLRNTTAVFVVSIQAIVSNMSNLTTSCTNPGSPTVTPNVCENATNILASVENAVNELPNVSSSYTSFCVVLRKEDFYLECCITLTIILVLLKIFIYTEPSIDISDSFL